MNQSFNQRAAPPGVLYEVKNCRIVAGGVLECRPGTLELTGATNTPSAILITGNGSTSHIEAPCFASRIGSAPFIGTTAGQGFCLDRSSASNVFHFQGRFSTCQPLRKRNGVMDAALGSGAGFGGKPAAQAVNSAGYVLYGAVDESSIAHVFIENPDGVRVYFERQSSTTKVQALAVGTTFYCIFQNGTDVTALSLTPDGTDVERGTETTVATLTGSSAHWDSSAYDGTHWYLVHQSAAGTMRVDRFSGLTSNANVTFAVTGTVPCSIFANSTMTTVWVGYYNDPTVTGNVRFRVYSNALVSVKGETTIVSAADIYGPPLFGRLRSSTPGDASLTTAATIVFRHVESGGNGLRSLRWAVGFSDGTATSSVGTIWHVLPISKPDNYNRVWCVTDTSSTNFLIQRTVLLRLGPNEVPLVELSSPNMAGKLGAYDPSGAANYFHAIATGSSSSFFGFPFVLNATTSIPLMKIEVYEYLTTEQRSQRETEPLGQFTVVSGQPTEFLGRPYSQIGLANSVSNGAAEVGFAQAPVITAAASLNGSDGSTHSYRVVYEWSDAYGRRHRSPPSVPISVSSNGANMSVQLTFTSIDVTQRVDDNQMGAPMYTIYRSQNGGSTYNRVPLSGTASDPTNGYIQVTDSSEDSEISGNEFVYTDGGVLENTLAPACRFLASSEDRLWFGGLWDPRIIQCSKVIIPEEPIQCTDHPAFQVTLLGECTGLAYQDGQVVAFTAEEIYLISGDGPNDQGAGQFSPPRKLGQNVGCVDHRSVRETNIGIIFLSAQGFMLLPRGFGPVEFIGAAVRDLTQGAPDAGGGDFTARLDCISSAAMTTHNGSLARFLLASAGTSSGANVVTYDINNGQWYWDTYGMAALGVIGAWPNGFVHVSQSLSSAVDGPIWYEDRAAIGDGDTLHISQSVRTAWIQPFGPGAHGLFKAAQLSFLTIGSCTVTMTVSTDGASSSPGTWAVTAPSSVINYREVVPQEFKGTAFQVTVTITAPGTESRGVKFLGLTIEAESDGGRRLLASSEKA